MSSTRSTRSSNQRLSNKEGKASDSEDSQSLVEQRLKNLLSTKRNELIKAKNIFNDFQGDVPKLRHSVIDRALQKVICSTPMPTEKQRDFFNSETSFNISPIDPLSEEAENCDYVNKDDIPVIPVNEKVINKEAKVILTRTPNCETSVVVLDSSSETENHNPNKTRSKGKKSQEGSIPEKVTSYNTRRKNKNESGMVTSQVQESSKIATPNETSKFSAKGSNQKESCSRKRIDLTTSSVKIQKLADEKENTPSINTRTRSRNRSQNTTVHLDQTKNVTNKTRSPSRSERSKLAKCLCRDSPNQGTKRSNSKIKSKSRNEESPTRSSTRRNKSGNVTGEVQTPNKSGKTQTELEESNAKSLVDEINDKKNQNQSKTKTPGRCSSRLDSIVDSLRSKTPVNNGSDAFDANESNTNHVNSSRRDKTDMKTPTNANSSKHATYFATRELEHNDNLPSKENLHNTRLSQRESNGFNEDTATTITLSQKKSIEKTAPSDHSRKISPRKLYFPEKEGELQAKNQTTAGKVTKIPVLRSRSKSKEKTGTEIPSGMKTRTKSVEAKEILPNSPPKRPPRRKRGKNVASINMDKEFTEISLAAQNAQDKLNATFTSENATTQDKEIAEVAPILSRDVPNVESTAEPDRISKIHNKLTSLAETGTSPCSFANSSPVLPIAAVIEAPAMASVACSPIVFESEQNAKINTEKDLPNKTVEGVKQPTVQEKSLQCISAPNKILDLIKTNVVDIGTSPFGGSPPKMLGYEKEAQIDADKVDKLNRLLEKMSQKLATPVPAADDTNINPTQADNHSLRSSKIYREAQTSVKRSSRRLTARKSFARSIFTRTVIEQQTQTTNSFNERIQLYRNKKSLQKPTKVYNSDSSRNTSTTDQSEVLKELETEENMLFQSLKEGILPPSFSSSEDEIPHSMNEQNLPWRIDDDILPIPRRSSYKLSFLRSAREIEMERRSSINPTNKYNTSDSDSEVEGRCSDKRRRKSTEKRQVLGYTRRNKVQVYAKPIHDMSPVREPPKPTLTDEERSSSPNSLVQVPPAILAIENNLSPVLNEEVDSEVTLTSKNVEAHNKSYDKQDSIGDRVMDLISRGALSLSQQHVEAPEESHQDDESVRKSVVEGRVEEDEEVLAVPLEDSDAAQNQEEVESVKPTRRSERKIVSVEVADENVEINKNVSVRKSVRKSNVSEVKEQAKEPEFKVPTKRGRKPKQKVVSEIIDDAVSSTSDYSEQSGVRRSGRERKPTQRRVLGVVATHSEKVLHYYNGIAEPISTQPNFGDITKNQSTKPRTKRQTNTGKKLDKKNDKSVVRPKNTKPSRKTKNKLAEKQDEPETIDNNVEIPDSNKDCDDIQTNISQPVDNNDALANKSKTSRRKKRNSTVSSTSEITVTNEVQTEIPNKKNKRATSINESQMTRTSNRKSAEKASESFECGVSCSNLDIDNNFIPTEANLNSQNNNEIEHPVRTESPCKDTQNIDELSCPGDIQETTCNNLIEHAESIRSADKDSGRSTMLRSTTFSDSNLKMPRPLTGRVGKKYKKKEDNIGSKISKVLSRSINHSKELEFPNVDTFAGTEASLFQQDDRQSRRSSLIQAKLTEGEYIHLLANSDIVSMKYVDQIANYEVVRDNLMVTDPLKVGGGTMGFLKLLPGCQKPLHIARKFNLGYFVIDGEGFIQVHNKTSKVGKMSRFCIPLGIEYSIHNLSKDVPLVLAFVKIPPNESQNV